jgi:LEA14-like dessication related protein
MGTKFYKWILIAAFALIFSACGKVNDISVKGFSDVKLRGIKKNVVMLYIDVEVDNPNKRKITISHIEFKAWLRDRELGEFRIAEPIKLVPRTQQKYTVPVEIELRTIADAFRLATGSIDDLLDSIEVEGVIKGRSFPVRKKLTVNRQPFRNLANSL